MQKKFFRALPGFVSSLLLMSAGFYTHNVAAGGLVQFSYSPVGAIFEHEEEFEFNNDTYDKYEMEYDKATGARLLIDIFYLSYRHTTLKMNDDIPDATVETYSIGLGCISKYDLGNNMQGYTLTGLGAGSGEFTFENPDLKDEELLLEANFETGLVLQKHLTVGIGIEAQHFGNFSESMATSVNAYVSAGFLF